jgi:hypothetical protein
VHIKYADAAVNNMPIAFYLLGTLFTLYALVAAWQSKDERVHAKSDLPQPKKVSIDRRMRHWWRAQRR